MAHPHRGMDPGTSPDPEGRHVFLHDARTNLVCVGMAMGCGRGGGPFAHWTRGRRARKHVGFVPHLRAPIPGDSTKVREPVTFDWADGTRGSGIFDPLAGTPSSLYTAV